MEAGDEIIASIRCTIQITAYRITKPGLLAATSEKLIFTGDSFTGVGFTEIYEYAKVRDFRLKKGLFNKFISMNYQGDSVKFQHLYSSNPEEFANLIASKIKRSAC